MQTLYALDLTAIPGTDDLWRSRRSVRACATNHPILPADGFASPLGFWFAAAESWGNVDVPLRIEVRDVAERDGLSQRDRHRANGSVPATRFRRASLKLTIKRSRAGATSTPLLLEIDSSTARIEVASNTWSSVSEAVLIVVAQFWRLLAIDRALDELIDWARGDLKRGGLLDSIRGRRSRELQAHRRVLQTLILDLPDFEAFLTNPGEGLAQGRPIQIHRSLVRQLGLNHQRRAVDERVEVAEAVFDSLAESLHHFQALAFQLVLELAIVALLVLDVGLFFLNASAR